MYLTDDLKFILDILVIQVLRKGEDDGKNRN